MLNENLYIDLFRPTTLTTLMVEAPASLAQKVRLAKNSGKSFTNEVESWVFLEFGFSFVIAAVFFATENEIDCGL